MTTIIRREAWVGRAFGNEFRELEFATGHSAMIIRMRSGRIVSTTFDGESGTVLHRHEFRPEVRADDHDPHE